MFCFLPDQYLGIGEPLRTWNPDSALDKKILKYIPYLREIRQKKPLPVAPPPPQLSREFQLSSCYTSLNTQFKASKDVGNIDTGML